MYDESNECEYCGKHHDSGEWCKVSDVVAHRGTAAPVNMDQIMERNKKAGYLFFSDKNSFAYRSHVFYTVYQGVGGIYFVTSEQPDNLDRGYTVRQFHPDTADISTVGGFGGFSQFATKEDAIALAEQKAKGA